MRFQERRIIATGLAALGAFSGWTGQAGIAPASAAEPEIAFLMPTVPVAPSPHAGPDMLLKAATLVVTASLGRDADLQEGRSAKIAELVESRILPLFDLPRMTRRAVALDWRTASPEQQVALIDGFRTLLKRTYATLLSKYYGQAIEFKPVRTAAGDTMVTVRSIVKQPGTGRVSIDYDMEMTAAGWKVHDVKIAGISMIATSRPIFAQAVRDSGVPGLINVLSASKRETGTGRAPDASDAVPILLMHALISGALRGGR